MVRLKSNKGISLITLVITIIVVIILAAAVILGLQNNNPIDSATKAKFLNDVTSFKDELEMYKQGEIIKDTKFNPTNLNTDDATNPSTYEAVPSLQGSSYKNSEGVCDFYVEKGKLVYRGTNNKYQDWAKDAKIEVDKGQVHVAITAMQIKPVKQGTDIKYSVALTSTSKITDVDTSKMKVIDSSNNEITATITTDVSEGDTSKTVTVTIDTSSLVDGEYNVKVEAGFASNETGVPSNEVISTDSFAIDSTAPEKVTEFSINPTGYTSGNVTLTMTKPVDADKIEYSEDGGNSYTEYSGAIIVTENKTIYVRAIDAAGNIAENTIAITNIDRIAPNAATINASVVDNKTINATITLKDERENGIDISKSKYIISTVATAYDTTNTAWNSATTITTNPQTISQTETTAGDYYIQVLSVDTAGNKAVTISGKLTVTINEYPQSNPPVSEGTTGTTKTENTTINGKNPSFNNPVIPAGFFAVNTTDASWNNVSTAWNNGLVIQDTSGNQFVWVPVNGTDVTYAKWCTSGIAWNDSGISDDTFPDGLTEGNQITVYHGFYIARYEASFDYNGGSLRAASKKSTNKTTSSWTRDSTHSGYLWNYINYDDSKSYTENMDTAYGYNTAKVVTALATGTQWDSTMKWIQNSGKSVTDSRAWGNYNDSVSPANVSGYGSLQLSGYSEQWKAKNIYDLAGNVFEWTSEKYSSNLVNRGGVYYGSGSLSPASCRNYNTRSYSGDGIGFRAALYIK